MKKENNSLILKTLVGSRAHGLATKDSDYDYRGVFVAPTEDILKVNGKITTTHWIEGNDDDTSWEIGHFLKLATACNPTILEVFFSPVLESTELGQELIALFPHVWNAQGVRDAFIGYSHNQRKKLMDGKDERGPKYAAAYLRVLYNAEELLRTGQFTVNISETDIYKTIRAVKDGDASITLGDIINKCQELEASVNVAFKSCDKTTDMDAVNAFLLKVRRQYLTA